MGKLTDCLKSTKKLRKQFEKGASISKSGSHVFDGVPGSMVVERSSRRCIVDDRSTHFIVWDDEKGHHSPWRAKDWFRPATNTEIREYYE